MKKKLFILTPLILLTSILYSADMASISVQPIILYHDADQNRFGFPAPLYGPELRFEVDLNHETLASLAQKINNNYVLRADPRFNGFNVEMLSWAADGFLSHPITHATLRDMGIAHGQRIIADVEELSELPEIKEPDVD